MPVSKLSGSAPVYTLIGGTETDYRESVNVQVLFGVVVLYLIPNSTAISLYTMSEGSIICCDLINPLLEVVTFQGKTHESPDRVYRPVATRHHILQANQKGGGLMTRVTILYACC